MTVKNQARALLAVIATYMDGKISEVPDELSVSEAIDIVEESSKNPGAALTAEANTLISYVLTRVQIGSIRRILVAEGAIMKCAWPIKARLQIELREAERRGYEAALELVKDVSDPVNALAILRAAAGGEPVPTTTQTLTSAGVPPVVDPK